MSDLLERLEKATGPDRELDIAIAQLLPIDGWKVDDDGTAFAFGDMGDGEGWFPVGTCPPVTSSIDDALALARRVLPGWTVGGLHQGDNKLWTAELREGHATSYNRVVIEPRSGGTTLPLAVCISVLKASAATAKSEGKQ